MDADALNEGSATDRKGTGMARGYRGALTCPRCGGAGTVPPPATLAGRLQTMRDGLNLTLREVESRTGGKVSNAYLSQIETGKVANPGADTLIALADVYGVTVDAILGRNRL
jgi:hypothetical protein